MIRLFAAILLLLAAAAPARAAEQSPQAFLQSIYSHYRGGACGEDISPNTPANARRYFEPALAKLIIADAAAAARRGDVPALDSDPFIDAQDCKITALTIRIDAQDAGAARATVGFRNFNKPDVVRIALVHTPNGWRIADIIWREGTLSGLYRKP